MNEEEEEGTNALRDTTFVFRREGLTEDEAYALLTENASGVLDLGDDDEPSPPCASALQDPHDIGWVLVDPEPEPEPEPQKFIPAHRRQKPQS